MRILFLDDEEWRHKEFDRILLNQDVVVDHVWSVDEAWEKLETHQYDLASFDHDLSIADQQQGLGEFKEKNGTLLARMIRDSLSSDKYPLAVIVHSWNSVGAKEMVKTLTEVGIKTAYVPFSSSNVPLF